jgi:hypothetical protein
VIELALLLVLLLPVVFVGAGVVFGAVMLRRIREVHREIDAAQATYEEALRKAGMDPAAVVDAAPAVAGAHDLAGPLPPDFGADDKAAHRVQIWDTRPLASDSHPFDEAFNAVCACGWTSDAQTDAAAAVTAGRGHSSNVDETVWRPLG